MENEEKTSKKRYQKHLYHHGSGGAVYGIGLVGALFYFIQTADSFWTGVLGVLKAIVWPGILVYEALKVLNL